MEKLTAKEVEIMHLLWNVQKAFIKDLLTDTPAPKPHYNMLSTIIRNLEEKGYVGHTEYGGTFEYYPLVSKEQYRQIVSLSMSIKISRQPSHSEKKGKTEW
ncbi:MAG: BlaI/MecI/CopY family transcriptional regulator [Bacteroidota bacterium]